MRVLIVDDQEFIRRGVRAVLTEEEDIEVCGEAVDGRDAILKALELKPDVVLMDISMPRLDGLEAAREIHRQLPHVYIITLSQYDLPEIIKEAMEAGAVTHVSKLFVWTLLVPALRNLPVRGVLSAAPDFDARTLIRPMPRAKVAREQAFRESEERFRCTFEATVVGMGHVAEDGRWLRVNQKLCEMIGYKREEIQNLTFQDITHPADLACDLEQTQRIVAGELDHFSMDSRYIRKDGAIAFVRSTIQAVRNANGKLKYFIRVAEDIGARRKAEAQLAQAQRDVHLANLHLNFVGDRLSVALTRCSRELRYVWANQNYANWLQQPLERIVGRPILDVVGKAAFDALRDGFEQVLDGAYVEFEKHEVVYPRIGSRSISAAYRPTLDSAGVPDGWVAIVRDITMQAKTLSASTRSSCSSSS